MFTLRNRFTMISALALTAALLASAGAAEAKGGGAIAGNRITGVNTVNGGPTVTTRDHRGNRNGEGGVTVVAGPPRHCKADICVTNTSWSGFKGRVYDHRSR
jgi:hypothetical protein